MLPILLPCNDPGAASLISTMANHGSAKEVIIAVQEAAERLERSFEDDFDEPEEETGTTVEAKSVKQNTPIEQLKLLVDLYAAGECSLSHCRLYVTSNFETAIPRVNPRRKTASQTIEPLLKDLKALLKTAGPRMGKDETRSIITSSVNLSRNVYDWVISLNQNNLEERNAAKVIH